MGDEAEDEPASPQAIEPQHQLHSRPFTINHLGDAGEEVGMEREGMWMQRFAIKQTWGAWLRGRRAVGRVPLNRGRPPRDGGGRSAR
jgi:hypothetical protein